MNKIKIFVVGLGRIGKIHLTNLQAMDEVEIVGICDPTDEAKVFSSKAGLKFYQKDFRDIASEVQADAIVICSPTDTHANYVSLAAKKGIDVFCEKPLDLSLEKVKEVLKTVNESKIRLMLGFNRRFDSEFQSVKEKIVNGHIGDIHTIKITSRDPSPPPISYIKSSGGMFLDMTIHDFDMIRYLTDKEIVEVYAKGDSLINSEIAKAGDIDTAIVNLTFEDGSMAVIDNCRKAVYGYDQRVEVFGSKGMVQSKNKFDNHSLTYTEKGVTSSLPQHFFLERYADAYKKEINHFIDCIRHKKTPKVSGYDGLMSLLLGLCAKESLNCNKPVLVSEIDKT
jgi:myo-inositol 2-dehydrogenase/D-chiro-inositol 1-dehydrogenase